jgi:hypothetical protein
VLRRTGCESSPGEAAVPPSPGTLLLGLGYGVTYIWPYGHEP